MNPSEFRNSMNSLRSKFPFMDAVLSVAKEANERDRAYAYNVMGRIPRAEG